MADRVPFTCPVCNRVSYNPFDAIHRFCPVDGFVDDRLDQPLNPQAAGANGSALHAVQRAPKAGEYAGLSYEAASRRAAALVTAAHDSGCWLNLPEHLRELRDRVVSGRMRFRDAGDRDASPRGIASL